MSGNSSSEILEIFRPLRLPIEMNLESEVSAELMKVVARPGEPLQETLDRAVLITDQYLEGERHALLDAVVRSSIVVGMPSTGGALLAPRYRRLFEGLATTLLSRDLAAGLLSEAPLIFRLAVQQRMSATQIAMVMSQVLGGTFFPYKAVEQVMTALSVRASVEAQAARALAETDQELSIRRFADANLAESAAIMGEAGYRLGLSADLEEILCFLCPPENPSEAFIPYLQTLEFLCTVTEFYDHPPEFLYEFSPRGSMADEIFGRYPIGLAPAGNPVLNNFKAVEAADMAWARSRPSHKSVALVQLLEGLSKMPYGPRKDLAAWIRQWLVRAVSLLDNAPVRLINVPAATAESVWRLFDWVSAGNTESAGAVEQRTVDALSALCHPTVDGWRERGIGDATTISNLSRKKMGDIEFQDSATRRVEAFEPHGGRLSVAYLEGHIRSSRRVIVQRLEGWRSLADLAEWSIVVRFIAHDLPQSLRVPDPVAVEGVRLEITVETFESFIDQSTTAASPEDLLAAVSEYVFAAMNRPQVPQSLRNAVAERCGLELTEPEPFRP
jgi:hypothetical protein